MDRARIIDAETFFKSFCCDIDGVFSLPGDTLKQELIDAIDTNSGKSPIQRQKERSGFYIDDSETNEEALVMDFATNTVATKSVFFTCII